MLELGVEEHKGFRKSIFSKKLLISRYLKNAGFKYFQVDTIRYSLQESSSHRYFLNDCSGELLIIGHNLYKMGFSK